VDNLCKSYQRGLPVHKESIDLEDTHKNFNVFLPVIKKFQLLQPNDYSKIKKNSNRSGPLNNNSNNNFLNTYLII